VNGAGEEVARSPHPVIELEPGRSDPGFSRDSGYALPGDMDLLLMADFTDQQSAVKASVGLAKLQEVSFSTSPVQRLPARPARG
jgi:hypothetical protein